MECPENKLLPYCSCSINVFNAFLGPSLTQIITIIQAHKRATDTIVHGDPCRVPVTMTLVDSNHFVLLIIK